ncbi:GldG family protein [Marispirochaeta aestuarii]|uniref:GldG family protein n=1 Tax=Marispirochaeta aestuarii TaxID=1963862 RepID=UPI0029C7C46D|nr:GldG family protein [Marispirochaeta aestuarii]
MATKRSFDYSLLVIPLLLLAILVIVQVLSYRFTLRSDLTDRKLYSLSEKSLNVLRELDGSPLKATAFFLTDDYNRESTRDLLDQYRQSYTGFEFELVDPSKNPRLVEKYEVGSNGTIVLEYQGRETKVVSQEEESITNAIHRLAVDSTSVLYFLSGHGEKTPEEGFRELAGALQDEHYETRELLLLREDSIPDDADAIVIAGLREALSDHEIGLITEYFETGGNILFMADPYRRTGLEEYLAENGILLGIDTIVDERSQVMGGDYLFPIVSDYGRHSITESIDLITFFPIARSITVAEEKPEETEISVLARTGADTWAEMDYEALGEGQTRFDPELDVPGPLTLGVALSREDSDGKGGGRMVIYGDSDFADDDYIDVSGNKDLIMNTFAWLTSDPSLIGIRSRDPSHTPIILTEGQTRAVFWLLIVLLPAMALIAGAGVWLVSRWKK